MNHVAALTSGLRTPSARFRVRQYVSHLRAAGIEVTEHHPALSQGARLPGRLGEIRMRYLPPIAALQMVGNLTLRLPGAIASHRSQVTWLERSFVPGLDDMSFLLKRPLVLDIDDSIWLYNPFGRKALERLLARSEMVFAGNTFIANWCLDHCRRVEIIPTAVDTTIYVPSAEPRALGERFTIGWIGTSGNFRFLNAIEPGLARFLRSHPSADLMVVADREPIFPSLPRAQVRFRRWSEAEESSCFREFDVGIMPIDDTDLSRGKCSFKMLQYMAAGLPVIVSPYGMNRELLSLGTIGIGAVTHQDWDDALSSYFAQPESRQLHGGEGRRVAETGFDTALIAGRIAKLFNALI